MCRKRQTRSEDSPPAYDQSTTTIKQEKGNQPICQLHHANVVRLTCQFDARLRLDVRVNHADACVIHEDLNVQLFRPNLLYTVPNRVRIC